MPFHEHFDLTDFTVLEIYETWMVFVVKYRYKYGAFIINVCKSCLLSGIYTYIWSVNGVK